MKPLVSDGQVVDVPCGLCGCSEGRRLYRGRPLAIESLGYPRVVVTQCENCGFVFNSPRPDDEALSRFYAEDRLASGRTFREESEDAYYPQLFAYRSEFFAPFLAAFSRRADASSAGRMLDVGCGQGGFLRAMRDRAPAGWEFVGLDPCELSAPVAARAGFEIHTGSLGAPIFPDDSFDAISLISVLEHLTHPAEAMAEVVRMLRPEGLLVLEVPNILHPEPSLTSYFGLEHVGHFSPGTLCRLLREHGVGELRLDDRVRDHGLRLVAGSNLARWGCPDPEGFEDDRARAAFEIVRYGDDERRLLDWIDRHVGATLRRWVQEEKIVAVYGAGLHTEELAVHVDLSGVHFVVDGDRAKQGGQVAGKRVLAPEALAERGVNAVLISSHRFADEMQSTVLKICGPDVEVERCYPPDPGKPDCD